MKPIKRTVLVEIEYWDCGDASHKHETEGIASRCIERAAKKESACRRKKARHARCIYAARAVVNGQTFRAAGDSIGVTATRARELVMKVLRSSLHSRICGHKDAPCDYGDTNKVRQYKKHWLERIDKVAEYWGVQGDE